MKLMDLVDTILFMILVSVFYLIGYSNGYDRGLEYKFDKFWKFTEGQCQLKMDLGEIQKESDILTTIAKDSAGLLSDERRKYWSRRMLAHKMKLEKFSNDRERLYNELSELK